VINPVNTILREHYTDCDGSDVLELKVRIEREKNMMIKYTSICSVKW
jgi:hypothetical protein